MSGPRTLLISVCEASLILSCHPHGRAIIGGSTHGTRTWGASLVMLRTLLGNGLYSEFGGYCISFYPVICMYVCIHMYVYVCYTCHANKKIVDRLLFRDDMILLLQPCIGLFFFVFCFLESSCWQRLFFATCFNDFGLCIYLTSGSFIFQVGTQDTSSGPHGYPATIAASPRLPLTS